MPAYGSRAAVMLVIAGVGVLGWLTIHRSPQVSAQSPPSAASLNVVYEQQAADQWCWAASADMVVETLGSSAMQCQTANLGCGRNDCCSTVLPGACDETGWPPFKKLHFTNQLKQNRALTLSELMAEIGVAGRPVAASWEWTDSVGARTGTGHMFVVGGYFPGAEETMLEIYDPLCDPDSEPDPQHPCGYRTIPYSEYDSGALLNGTTYLHWNDFYGIQMQ